MSNGAVVLAAPGQRLLDVARRRFFYGPGASIVTIAVGLLSWVVLGGPIVRAVDASLTARMIGVA